MIDRPQAARFVAVAALAFGLAARASAAECSAEAVCSAELESADVVALRDGSALCGTILHRESDRYVLIISGNETKTIDAAEIECIGTRRGLQPKAHWTASELTPEPSSVEPQSDGLSLAWDLRVVSTTLLKRYVERDVAAWSWGIGAGVGFGAALHWQPGAASNRAGSVSCCDLELGFSGAVTYGTWHSVDGRSAAAVEQDTSLVLGMRVALGGALDSGRGRPRPAILLGLAWLPSYVDFYGRDVQAEGSINPAGVRLSLDVGSVLGPELGRSTALRLVLAFLPYVGRLPTAFSLGAGLVFH